MSLTRRTDVFRTVRHRVPLGLIIGCCVVLSAGCSSSTRTVRVAVPPRVDLHAYPSVGLVTFSTSADTSADLERMATQRFLQEIQAAQPGTRVVELGREADVLASVHRSAWDPQTLRAVKEANGVDAILLGRLDITKAKPRIQLSTSALFKGLDVHADVNATLTARLLETGSAATMWSDSSRLTTNLANASVNNRGGGHIGVRDGESAYPGMIDQLVCDVTDAFRTHYVTRTVPKEQVETATASAAGD
jgi:hypothetical protein